MPRRMSFAKTQTQMQNKTKTETRRLGWNSLKSGDVVFAVNKTMGLKKGEKSIVLNTIQVLKTWREPLNKITQAGVVAEGFPEMTVAEFIEFFCDFNKCKPDLEVRVIQFSYVLSATD